MNILIERPILISLFIFLWSIKGETVVKIFSVSNSFEQDNFGKYSSLGGGTTLYIKGSGFDKMMENNQVMVGQFPCSLTGASSLYLICQTSPSPQEQTLLLSVIVNKRYLSQCADWICSIKYQNSYTPQHFYVLPRSMTPAGYLHFYGAFKATSTEQLLMLKMNSFICDRIELEQEELSRWSKNSVKCRAAPELVGGLYNTSIETTNGQKKSMPQLRSTCSKTLQVFEFRAVPVIDKVGSSYGNDQGGQLKIYGFGFSTDQSKINVNILGQPCKVLKSSLNEIDCQFNKVTQSLESSYYVGGSGFKVTKYQLSKYITAQSLRDILNDNDNTNDPAKFFQGVQLELEMEESSQELIGQKLIGFFKPSVDGNHKFYISGDDSVVLYISDVPNNSDLSNLKKILQMDTYTGFREYLKDRKNQISEYISFKKDNYYLMEVIHTQGTGNSHFSVSVEVPSTEYRVNSIVEVQKVQIKYTPKLQQMIFTIYGATEGLWWINWNNRDSAQLKIDASQNDVANAINGAFGYPSTSCTRENLDANGKITEITKDINGYKWNCTLNKYIKSESTPFINYMNLKGSFKQSTQHIISSDPIRGTFTLSYDGKTTDDMRYDSNDHEIFKNLTEKLGFSQETSVTRQGDCDDGCTYEIYFYDQKTEMQLLSAQFSQLTGGKTGTQPYIEIVQEIKNSKNQLYQPLPNDMMYTSEQKLQAIVEINGVRAACPSQNCDFYLLTEYTHILEDFKVTGTGLTLTWSNPGKIAFHKDWVLIQMGGQICTLDANPVEPTTLCKLPQNSDGSLKLVAGDHFPSFLLINLGYSKIKTGLSPHSIEIVIDSIDPIKGSQGGGTVLNIKGKGFPEMNEKALLEVKIDENICQIVSTTNQEIQCLTPRQTGSSFPSNLQIKVNTKSKTSNLFSYDPSLTPKYTAKSPDSASPVIKSKMSITGSNFGTDKSQIQVFLDEENQKRQYELSILSIQDDRLDVILGGGVQGKYKLRIYKKPYGNFIAASQELEIFKYELILKTVSPNQGSKEGGTILTLTGENFSPILNSQTIFFGPDNIICDVVESSPTQIKCRTRKCPITYIDKPVEVIVSSKLKEEAKCSTCQFTYTKDSHTPQINLKGNITKLFNDILSLTGSLLNPQNVADTKLILNNQIEINVEGIPTTSKIEFKIPELPHGNYEAKVYISNYGYAEFPEKLFINIPLKMTSTSVQKGSRGGSDIIIRGSGFNSLAVVYLQDSYRQCQIKEQKASQIIAKCPDFHDDSKVNGIFVNQNGIIITCQECTYQTQYDKTPYIKLHNSKEITLSGDKFVIEIEGSQLDCDGNYVSLLLINLLNPNSLFKAVQKSLDSKKGQFEFEQVPAGMYNLQYQTQNLGYAHIQSQEFKTVKINIGNANIAELVQASYAGGAILTVSGLGYDNKNFDYNKVSVCEFPCIVQADTTFSQLKCLLPLLPSKKSDLEFNLLANQQLNPQSLYGKEYKQLQNLLDKDQSTHYQSLENDCSFTLDFGQGKQAYIEKIQWFPKIGKNFLEFNQSKFEGSNDNSTWTEIISIGIESTPGWNIWNKKSEISYRYVRFINGGESKCQIAEVEVWGKLYLENDIADLTSKKCGVKIQTENSVQIQIADKVEYRQDKTAKIESLKPDKGTTIGGTSVEISGQGFGAVKSDVEVFIDGIQADVQSVIDTKIVIVTNKRPKFVKPSLLVSVQKRIVANQRNLFYYIDRWSDSNTWGGENPPRPGESVYIPQGQNILLDMSTSVYGIFIEGNLIFEDKDMKVDATFIVATRGNIQIGTPENPFQSQLTITLYGKSTDKQLPMFGNKVLAVYNGHLDIHGKKRVKTWTLLSKTAEAEATEIYLQDTVDWQKGEEIVIASSDYNHNHSEVRTIKEVKDVGKTIVLDKALQYRHYSEEETFGLEKVPMFCEVGLLSRNIKIQGDPSDSWDDFHGGHTMIHGTANDGARARISYVEYRFMGQKINGRYPMHFHLCGDMPHSYFEGNAVSYSLARIVTVHGTNYLKVKNNVGYFIHGHNYFLENGVEEYNIFEDNLSIKTKQIWLLIDTDVTASAFWITNVNNYFRRNRAAGGDWFGFWIRLLPHSEGPSANPNICPDGMKIGDFRDNVAHSFSKNGLLINVWQPRTHPCGNVRDDNLENPWEKNPPVLSTLTNFIAWKNKDNGVAAEDIGQIHFENFKLVDNRLAGMLIMSTNYSGYSNPAMIKNAVIVGQSKNNAEWPKEFYADQEQRGINTPRTNDFFIDGVKFFNFNGEKQTAWGSCTYCWNIFKKITGGKTTRMKNIQYTNVTRKIYWEPLRREIYQDIDGSLTEIKGINGGAFVSAYYKHLVENNDQFCTRYQGNVWNDSVICKDDVQIRAIMLASLQPFNDFRGTTLKVLRLKENMDINTVSKDEFDEQIMVKIKPVSERRYAFAYPFVTGQSYNLHFNLGIDFTYLWIVPGTSWQSSDKPIILRFNYTDNREMFEAFRVVGSNMVKQYVQLSEQLKITNAQFGQFYQDSQNKFFYMTLAGNENATAIQVNGIRCRYTCPDPLATCEKEKSIRLWSDTQQWPNKVLPQKGDSVEIPCEWNLKMNVDPPQLEKLTINGNLIIDDQREINKIQAKYIWVSQGKIIAGSDSKPFEKKLEITLFGQKTDEHLLIGAGIEAGNKVLAVTGKLELFGKQPKVVYTKLAEYASAGQSTIKLVVDPQWSIGDEIIITSTSWGYLEHETFKIKEISNNIITLDSSLKYDHYGDSKSIKTDFGEIDMRSTVGLITRNILIQGDLSTSWGCHILIGAINEAKYGESPAYRRGSLEFSGVEIKNCGQFDSTKAGIDFKNTGVTNGDISYIRKSSIHSTEGMCIYMEKAMNVTIEDNIIAKCTKYGIGAFEQTDYIYFKRNLIAGIKKRSTMNDAASGLYDTVSAIDIHKPRYQKGIFEVSQNIAQGIEGVGFIWPPAQCGDVNGFYDNIAGSAMVGGMPFRNQSCSSVERFTAYRCDMGIYSYFDAKSMHAQKLIMAENNQNVILGVGTETDDFDMSIKNSLISAIIRPECSKCYQNPQQDCSNKRALKMSAITTKGKDIPIDKSTPQQLYSICTDSSMDSKVYMSNVQFTNWKLTYTDQYLSQCKNNRVFYQHGGAADSTATHFLSDVQCLNCEIDSLVKFSNPSSSWIGWMGGCGDVLCTGLQNTFITDTDGKFFGMKSQSIPHGPKFKLPCVTRQEWNGVQCAGDFAVQLQFEVTNEEKRDRLLSMVGISGDQILNNYEVNSFREWGWNGPNPKDERLQRFIAVVVKNSFYKIKYESYAAKEMRFKLQKTSDQNDFVVLEQSYDTPSSIQVLVNNKVVKPFFNNEKVDLMTKGKICGANNFFHENRTIQFVVTRYQSDCVVQVNQVNSVRVTLRLETTVEAFYSNNGPARFIDQITAFLGITTDQLKIVNVIAGSAIVSFNVDLQKGGNSEIEAQKNKISAGFESNLGLQYKILEHKLELIVKPVRTSSKDSTSIVQDNNVKNQDDDDKLLFILLGIFIPLIVLAFLLFCLCYFRKKKMYHQIQPPQSPVQEGDIDKSKTSTIMQDMDKSHRAILFESPLSKFAEQKVSQRQKSDQDTDEDKEEFKDEFKDESPKQKVEMPKGLNDMEKQ